MFHNIQKNDKNHNYHADLKQNNSTGKQVS